MAGIIAKAYLISYNLFQVLGWSYVAFLFLAFNFANDFAWSKSYPSVEVALKIFQTLAILEVIHSLVGIVSSPWLTTAIQVASRVFVVWAICEFVPEARKECIGVPMFITAWTITEIVRYSFYAAHLLGGVPYPLKWLRYTLFIVLYPLGVSGELITMYRASEIAERRSLLQLSLPNQLNFAFSFQILLYIVMFSYVPFFPSLYGYMQAQRRKVLGGDSRKKRE